MIPVVGIGRLKAVCWIGCRCGHKHEEHKNAVPFTGDHTGACAKCDCKAFRHHVKVGWRLKLEGALRFVFCYKQRPAYLWKQAERAAQRMQEQWRK